MHNLSIIIPVFNGEQWVDRCLQSIWSQSYTNFEVIVVNDGSEDHTLEVLEKYKEEKRLRIFSIKNSGVVIARSYGIKQASSDYLYFLDIDDFLSPDALKMIMKIAIDKQSEMVFSYMNVIYKTNNWTIKNEIIKKDKLSILKSFLKGEIHTYIGGLLLKKDLIKYVHQNKNIIYGEDAILLYTILLALPEIRLSILQEPVYNYQLHEQNSSSSLNPKVVGSMYTFAKNVENRFKDVGLWEACHTELCTFRLRAWVVYCRSKGYYSSRKKFRYLFFKKYAKNASLLLIPFYQRIELMLYTLYPRLGFLCTSGMKLINSLSK